MPLETPKSTWIDKLKCGENAVLVVFGTSLSFHLAPILREALAARFGSLITLVNAGMPAKASCTALQELDARVLRHAPDAVLLEWAVNDAYSYEEFEVETLDKGITLDQSRDNLELLIGRITAALPTCDIMVQTMNPTYDAPGTAFAGSRRPELHRFYEAAREVASAHGLTPIDHYAMWTALRERDPQGFERLIPDGAHPTPAALREWVVPHLLQQWRL